MWEAMNAVVRGQPARVAEQAMAALGSLALVEVVDLLFRVTSGDRGVQMVVPLALAVSLTVGAVAGAMGKLPAGRDRRK